MDGDVIKTNARLKMKMNSQPQQPTLHSNTGHCFLLKLHNVLSDPKFDYIIAWLPHGRAFRIKSKKVFEKLLMPCLLNHNSFSSFIELINGWGFIKITNSCYCHHLFLRGMPLLVNQMQQSIRQGASKQGNKADRVTKEVIQFFRTNPVNDEPVQPSSAPSIATIPKAPPRIGDNKNYNTVHTKVDNFGIDKANDEEPPDQQTEIEMRSTQQPLTRFSRCCCELKVGAKMHRNEIKNFPSKLYSLLSNPKFQAIVAWLPHGRAFRVKKIDVFEKLVLLPYFEYSEYPSFVKDATGWGFRKITSTCFFHDLFLRGLPHLADQIECLSIEEVKLRQKKESAVSMELIQFFRSNPLSENYILRHTKETNSGI